MTVRHRVSSNSVLKLDSLTFKKKRNYLALQRENRSQRVIMIWLCIAKYLRLYATYIARWPIIDKTHIWWGIFHSGHTITLGRRSSGFTAITLFFYPLSFVHYNCCKDVHCSRLKGRRQNLFATTFLISTLLRANRAVNQASNQSDGADFGFYITLAYISDNFVKACIFMLFNGYNSNMSSCTPLYSWISKHWKLVTVLESPVRIEPSREW